MSRKIEIDDMVTVGDLATRLELPATTLIGELFKNGVMATINEKIDFDTATILVEELKLEVELTKKETEDVIDVVEKAAERENADLKVRPPVVAVMGHVDHGKTSLLDKIREANVADKEAGGITQHISAYQVERGDRKVTFLDTPGHEAFAAIREHGAVLTDMVVIVVAADDGLKPQTLEAIRFANKAGVKMIVAANKMDKEGANIERLKGQLSEQKMIPEDYGGDTVVVPVSAKTGEGIDKLIEMILLVADVEDLKADVNGEATGLVIEAEMIEGMGPTAVTLVQQGILKKNDFIVAGSAYGKVKVLTDTYGNKIPQAGPSTPVSISGFKSLPSFGDSFTAVKNEKEAKKIAAANKSESSSNTGGMSSTEMLRIISRRTGTDELNVLIKADVQGSLTSVSDSIKSIDNDEIATKIVGSGIGAPGENDIRTAAATGAIIYGFNTDVPANIRRLASESGVEVRTYRVIYELLDDIREELEKLLSPELIETEVGELKVMGIFNTTKTEVIAGGEVLKGPLMFPAKARVLRAKKKIAEVEVTGLKRGPQDVHEVPQGEMCGINLKTESKLALEEGDRLELYTQELKDRKL